MIKTVKFKSIISILLCTSMLSSMQPLSASNHDQNKQQSYYEWTKNGIKKGAQWSWNYKVEIVSAAVVLGVAAYFGSQYMKSQNTGADLAVNPEIVPDSNPVLQYNPNATEALSMFNMEALTPLNIFEFPTIDRFLTLDKIQNLLNNQKALEKLFIWTKLKCLMVNSLVSQNLPITAENEKKIVDEAKKHLDSLAKGPLNQELKVLANILRNKLNQ